MTVQRWRGGSTCVVANGCAPSGSPRAGTVSDTGPDGQQSPRSGHLLRWRACAAADLGVPPYLVLSDATMAALATLARGDAQALAALPGIGPRALAKHGAHLLRLIAAYPPDRYVGSVNQLGAGPTQPEC